MPQYRPLYPRSPNRGWSWLPAPTFKAAYTGLLKLFLDQFAGGTRMQGVVAVPLMLGAGPAHAMAPDLLLKPVLVELGATCHTPGLYLNEKTFEDGVAIKAFADRWGPWCGRWRASHAWRWSKSSSSLVPRCTAAR